MLPITRHDARAITFALWFLQVYQAQRMVGIEPDTRVDLRIWVAMPTVRTRHQTYRSAFLSCLPCVSPAFPAVTSTLMSPSSSPRVSIPMCVEPDVRRRSSSSGGRQRALVRITRHFCRNATVASSDVVRPLRGACQRARLFAGSSPPPLSPLLSPPAPLSPLLSPPPPSLLPLPPGHHHHGRHRRGRHRRDRHHRGRHPAAAAAAAATTTQHRRACVLTRGRGLEQPCHTLDLCWVTAAMPYQAAYRAISLILA